MNLNPLRRLPKGARRNPGACPLFNALKAMLRPGETLAVGGIQIKVARVATRPRADRLADALKLNGMRPRVRTGEDGILYEIHATHTSDTRSFINRFDDGRLPEYDERHA